MTDEDFKKEVLECKEPVLVDFFAEWCQPCKQLDKILPKLGIKIVKIDVMQNQEMASQYMVQSVPFTLIFNKGEVVSAMGGLQPLKKYKEVLDELNDRVRE